MSSKVEKGGRQPISKKSPPLQQLPPDPTAHLNPKQKVSYFLNNIQEKIIHEIDQHKQPVSSSQSPFFQNQHSKAINKNQEQLKKLTQQKKITQKKYQELAELEFQLKHDYKMKLKQKYHQLKPHDSRHQLSREHLKKDQNSKTQRPNDKPSISPENEFLNNFQIPHEPTSLKTITSTYKIRPKSQLTAEDIKTLKSLKSQYNKFEQQISQKTIKHNEQLQKIRKQNMQFEQMMKKEKNQKKKKQIQLKLQDLERLKQQRIKKYEEERNRLMEVKKKPKRFQKLMKQFQNKEKIFQEKKLDEMKLRLKNKLLDMSQITQHQKRYQQLRQQQLKEIQEKYMQNTRILKQSRFQPEHKSRFYRSVLEQEKERKLSHKKKELATIQKCERVKYYAQRVHEEYAPRVKSRENEEESQTKSDTKEERSLSVEDRQKLGNNYLKEVINHLKQQQKAKHTKNSQGKKSSTSFHASTSQSSHLPPISSLSTKYKDYLSEQRNKQGSSQEYEELKQKRARLKYTNSIEQVRKLMSEEYSKKKRYETIDKIKEITDRLEHGQNQKNYIDKIRAKLEILETIT